MNFRANIFCNGQNGDDRVQSAREEIGNWFGFAPFWLSFFLSGVAIALTGALDTDQITSVWLRVILIVGLLLMSAIASATLAGMLRLIGGPSAFQRIDVAAKVGFLCTPFAALPGRALIAYIGETELTVTLFFRSVLHGWAVAIMVLAVLYITRFRALETEQRIESPSLPETIEPGFVAAEVPATSKTSFPNYMESEDHHLKIVCENSVELVRANLGETAEKFAAGGLRCHKSYWVAYGAIETRKRKGRQLLLVLKDGTEIPVGRSYEKAVRESLG